MAEKTAISWTDATFNPWWGCTKVSPACDNCYAERDSLRYGHDVWGKDAPRRFFGDAHWNNPIDWNAAAAREGIARRVFCASYADVMEERDDLQAPRERLFKLIERTPWLTWLLLTKRPQAFRRLLPAHWLEDPRPNVWLGATIESAAYLWRSESLTSIPAVVHFLSLEPLVAGLPTLGDHVKDIEWIITGGESGGIGKARPADPEWFRGVRDVAIAHSIPFHFKQWGEHGPDLVRIGKKKAGVLLDGVDWKQFPNVAEGLLRSHFHRTEG